MAPGSVTPTLSGALADCRPLVLLCFLADTEKTGVLKVAGARSHTMMWLERGRLVAAESDAGHDLVDCVVVALRTPAGTFSFTPPDDSPDSQARARSLAEGAGTPMASLLEQALERAQGWEEVSAAVPSLQAAIVLQPTTETEVRLSHAAWALSVAVAAGHATAATAAAHLDWTPLDTCVALRELVEAGRARLEPPHRRQRAARVAVLARREAGRASASEPDGDGVRGRSPRVAGRASASEPDGDGVRGRSPREAATVGTGGWHGSKRPLWPGAGSAPGDRFRIGWSGEE